MPGMKIKTRLEMNHVVLYGNLFKADVGQIAVSLQINYTTVQLNRS